MQKGKATPSAEVRSQIGNKKLAKVNDVKGECGTKERDSDIGGGTEKVVDCVESRKDVKSPRRGI